MERNKILLLLSCIIGFAIIGNSLPLLYFSEEICNNGIDDDNDGLIDCYDPDCCYTMPCDSVYFDPCGLRCFEENVPQTLMVQREWTSSNNNWHPYNAPIVGDLDGDGENEIVGIRGSWQGLIDYKNLLILNGQDGSVENVISTPWFRHTGSLLCIGDVDRNGRSEIFYRIGDSFANDADDRGKVVCLEFSIDDYIIKWISDSTITDGALSLADFNEDGLPELYTGNQIFNSIDGTSLIQGQPGASNGNGFSVAADVLPDDACSDCMGMELVVGNEVYAVYLDPDNPSESQLTLENRVTGNRFADGYTSLADMDADGDLDAVVSSPDGDSEATLYIWDIQEPVLLGEISFPATTNGWASLPCIKDINRDFFPEVAISGSSTLHLFSFDGEEFKERWQKKTADWSSRSGSTFFDLNGDGRFELLNRDQDQFRILDAWNGSTLFAESCISTNLFEHPIVVDVDQDGASEILCSCENELRAYGAGSLPWVSSRNIWNQYNYHYVNVNDDLTIPIVQQKTQFPGNGFTLNAYLNQYANESFQSNLSINLPPSTIIELGQNFDLTPEIIANTPITIEWLPAPGLDCTDCESITVSPETDQVYSIIVEDEWGCTDTASIKLTVIACGSNSFSMPNAFTPDADGVNDEFKIFITEGLDLTGSIAIYNRFGNRVFVSDNLTSTWNGRYKGRLAASDLYIVKVGYRCVDGKQRFIRAELTLIR